VVGDEVRDLVEMAAEPDDRPIGDRRDDAAQAVAAGRLRSEKELRPRFGERDAAGDEASAQVGHPVAAESGGEESRAEASHVLVDGPRAIGLQELDGRRADRERRPPCRERRDRVLLEDLAAEETPEAIRRAPPLRHRQLHSIDAREHPRTSSLYANA